MSRLKSPPPSPLLGPPARVPRPEPRPRSPRGRAYAKPDYETTRDVDPDLVRLATEPLPFERVPSRPPPPNGSPLPHADDEDERTAVLSEEIEPPRVVLPKPTIPPPRPSSPPGPARLRRPVASPSPRAPGLPTSAPLAAGVGALPSTPPPRPSTPAPPVMLAPLPRVPSDRATPSQPPLAGAGASWAHSPLGSASVRVPPPPSATTNPPPPELLGPRPPDAPSPPDPEDPAPTAPVEPSEPEPAPSEPPALAACAAVAARTHLFPEQKTQALADAELSEARWVEGCGYWDEVVATELRRGERATLERYDQHYVAELERLRGPIGPDEHARIDQAIERGTPELTFQELRLPLAGRMRIERVWIQRWCHEPALRVRYLEELRQLRTGPPRATR